MEQRGQEEPVVSRNGAAFTVNLASRSILGVFAIVAGVWLAARLTDFLLVVFFAILLATAIDQPVTWLQRRSIPRPAGVLAMFVLLIGLLGLVVVALIPLIGAETESLRNNLPGYQERTQDLLRRLSRDRQSDTQISLDRVTAQLSDHLNTVATRLTDITLTVGRLLVLLFATLVLAFFLASEPALLTRFLTRFSPRPWHPRALSVVAAIRERIGAWARGQVIIAASFGLVMGLALWALGVPYAATLGVVAGVLEVVPYIGGLVTVILAALMALSVGLPQVIGVVVIYVVLVNIESHVLAPVLFGRAVGLPSVAILLALLAGIELLGIVGAFLAVPATVIIWAVVEELWPSPLERPQRSAPRWLQASRAARGRIRRHPRIKPSLE